jgi:DNA-binding GntR family transcriptional regulator
MPDLASLPAAAAETRRAAGLKTLAEQIADLVGERIIAGVHAPGERILEQRLSDELSVSRGPVREALRILERQGLVIILPRRGAQVTQLTIAEVRDIFDIRAVLGGLAARLIAEAGDQEAIASLSGPIESLGAIARSGGTTEAYTGQAHQLNLLQADVCGNPRLREMMRSLSRQTLRYSQLGLSTQARRQRSAKLWAALLTAIAAGKGEEASALANRLVVESRDMAISVLRQAEGGA